MKILLVDLSAVFWWKWHGAAGQDIDAAHRYTVETVRGITNNAPHAALCCDSGTSFRKKLYAEYKANRPPKDAAALEQLRRVEETLAGDGFPIWKTEGLEGDDIIASAVAWSYSYDPPIEVVIAGSDKDLLQLLGENVSLLHLTTGETWTPETVRGRFKVAPGQMRDFLALTGDKADNIPGAMGIGAVKASVLLTQYGTIDGIYQNIDKVQPPSVQVSLVDNKDKVLLSRDLVALNPGAKVDFAAILKPRAPKDVPTIDTPDELADTMTGTPAEDELAAAAEEEQAIRDTPRDDTPEAQESPQAAPATAAEPKGPGLAKTAPTAALVVDPTDPRWMLALEPKHAQQAWWFAQALYKSRLYSKFPSPEAILAVILRGRSMGVDMMSALDGFHVIEGKPSPSAALIVGCVLRSGKAEYFENIELTASSATWATKRKSGRRKEVKYTYTVEMARRAGLIRPRGNWEKFPDVMCLWRAAVTLARIQYPDVVSNVYTPDELDSAEIVELAPPEVSHAATR